MNTDLDPVLVPPIENVFRVGMLQDETLATVGHDFFHPTPNILTGLALVFSYKLDAASNFLETRSKVTLTELGRSVQERHPVQVQQVEYLD